MRRKRSNTCDSKNKLLVIIVVLSLVILLSTGTTFFLLLKDKKSSNNDDKRIKNKENEEQKSLPVKKENPPIRQVIEEKAATNQLVSNNVEEEVTSFNEKERLQDMKFDFKRNERIISIVLVLFLVLIVFVGVNAKHSEKEEKKEIKAIAYEVADEIEEYEKVEIPLDEIVLTIGGKPITYEKYRYYCESLKKEMDGGDNAYWFEDHTKILKDEKSNEVATISANKTKKDLELKVIEKLKEMVVIDKLAIEYKMDVSDEEVETKLQTIIDNVGKDEFNKVLIENNISRTLYVEILKNTMQEEKLLKVLFYDEIKSKMEEMDIARVKHILVTYNDEIITSGDITEKMENALEENIAQVTTGVALEDIIVYETNDENAAQLGIIEKDDEIIVKTIDEEDIWFTIIYNEKEAFVKNENVQFDEDVVIQKERTLTVANEIANEDVVVKQLTKQEAFDLCNDILIKLDNGDDFDTLMQQYTEDVAMIDNPNGYYIVRDTNVEETLIETTAFNLEENAYSKIIETNLGFHIIYRCPLEEEYIQEHILDYADETIWLQYSDLLEQKTIGFEYIVGELYTNAFANVFYDAYTDYKNTK